jgi:hypothetical protein
VASSASASARARSVTTPASERRRGRLREVTGSAASQYARSGSTPSAASRSGASGQSFGASRHTARPTCADVPFLAAEGSAGRSRESAPSAGARVAAVSAPVLAHRAMSPAGRSEFAWLASPRPVGRWAGHRGDLSRRSPCAGVR